VAGFGWPRQAGQIPPKKQGQLSLKITALSVAQDGRALLITPILRNRAADRSCRIPGERSSIWRLPLLGRLTRDAGHGQRRHSRRAVIRSEPAKRRFGRRPRVRGGQQKRQAGVCSQLRGLEDEVELAHERVVEPVQACRWETHVVL